MITNISTYLKKQAVKIPDYTLEIEIRKVALKIVTSQITEKEIQVL
jgi:hypothetical protein